MVRALQYAVFLFVLSKRHLVTGQLGTSWSNVQNHAAWKILDKYDLCGENVADRIIGGLDAALGQFPWIVRLGYVSEYNETDWMCGGALVTDRHVVTAAHCIQYGPENEFSLSFIRVGEHDTTSDPDCRGKVCAPKVQDRPVRRDLVITHPLFNNPGYHNDIAVIRVEDPVQFNDYVVPICLPREPQMAPLPLRDLVTVAGWGKMNMSTDERATILQYVALPIVEPVVCNAISRGFTMLSSEICAGAQLNKDACGGDSGGPLMRVYDTPEGPKTFLVGVVSFGPTICGIKKPGVYTSTPFFLKWILDHIV